MRKGKFNYKFYLKLIVSLLLIVYLASKIDIASLRELSPILILYLIASILIFLILASFMVFRWKILIQYSSEKKARFADLYRYYLIGFFFNIFLPGSIGGDVTRIQNANKKYELGVKKSTLLVFLERISGLLALGFIFCAGAFLYRGDVLTELQINKPMIFLGLILLIASIVIFKIVISKKIKVTFSLIVTIIVFSGLGQFADVIIAYILSQYFQLNVTLIDVMIIMPLVYIATVLPISLGGIGVREGTMVTLFGIFAGVDPSIAVIISFLMYLSKIGAGLIGWQVYLRSKN